jgi:hypothetical protein
MPTDFKPQTKGNKIQVRFGGRKRCTFTAGGRKRYLVDDVFGDGTGGVMVNGEIRFADGSTAHALLEIDESSSGEHGGTGVFLPDGSVVFQGDKGFKEALAAAGVAEAFPYKYRCTAPLHTDDIHVGDDGWSR